MKRPALGIILAGLLLLSTTLIAANTSFTEDTDDSNFRAPSQSSEKRTQTKHSLQFLSSQVNLESPILSKSGVLFFPLRDALDIIQAELYYLRKEDSYRIEFATKGVVCFLTPYSKEFRTQRKTFVFQQAPFFDQQILYVPVKDFFQSLGYWVHISSSNIVISTLKTTAKKSHSPSTITLSFGTHTYDVPVTFKQGKKYIDLKTVLEPEGWTLTPSKNRFILSNGYRAVILSLSTPDAKQKLTDSLPVLSEFPLSVKNRLLVSVPEFFENLGYTFIKTSTQTSTNATQSYKALATLQAVSWKHDAFSPHLLFESVGRIEASKPTFFYSPEKGFYIDLYQTKKSPKFSISYENGPIKKITTTQISPQIVRIWVYFIGDWGLSSLETHPSGGKLHFYSKIASITETVNAKKYVLSLHTTGPVRTQFTFIQNPSRMILDLPHSLNQLPSQFIPTQNNFISRIRSSQFEINPAKTRIVFELDQAIDMKVIRKGTTLELEISTGSISQQSTKQNLVQSKHLKIQKISSENIKTTKPTLIRKKTLPLDSKVIVIDAGHGGDDPGALSLHRDYEKNYTLDIALRLQRLLTKDGAFIIMSRQKDQTLTLEDRVQLANANKPDLFISVHINSFFNPFSRGTETYYYKAIDKHLAETVHEALTQKLGLPDKGVRRARLYVLRHTQMPAVLVEPLYITNFKEYRLLEEPYFREKIAQGLEEGIIKYLSK